MRGRKPKPKLDQPTPAEGTPLPPDEVTGAARAEWDRITSILEEAGILSRADKGILTAYCLAYARLLKAETELAKTGEVVKSPSGYPIQNPWLAIARAAAKAVHTYGETLGLSPSSRSRIKMKKTPAANPFKVFMDGKGKTAKRKRA